MSEKLCIAFIADVVDSRRIPDDRRDEFQEAINASLSRINRTYTADLLADFIVTTGDEFQGLLSTAASIPDLLWQIERDCPVDIRVGLGLGTLTTRLQRQAIGMDGPAWHRARAAILEAKSHERLGGVFVGFGRSEDPALNALARLLRNFRDRLTTKQRETFGRLREAPTQVTLGEEFNLSPQAVNARIRRMNWDVYREGEAGLRALLARFDFTASWNAE